MQTFVRFGLWGAVLILLVCMSMILVVPARTSKVSSPDLSSHTGPVFYAEFPVVAITAPRPDHG